MMNNELLATVALAKFHQKQGTASQGDKVLLLLWKYKNKKVPVYKLVYDLRCHRFGARIFNLRKKGFDITTEKTFVKGIMHTNYILHF